MASINDFVTTQVNNVKVMSLTKKIIYGSLLLLGISYLVWSFIPKAAPNYKEFAVTKPAVSVPKTTGPMLQVPLKVVPKSAVRKAFPTEPIEDQEEVVDTAKIPPAPNGGTTISKIDTTTGDTKTDFKPSPPPLLAFENQNYLGGGVEYHVTGEVKAKIYYKRDVVRSKDVHLQVEVQGKMPISGTTGKAELFVGPNLEWRF